MIIEGNCGAVDTERLAALCLGSQADKFAVCAILKSDRYFDVHRGGEIECMAKLAELTAAWKGEEAPAEVVPPETGAHDVTLVLRGDQWRLTCSCGWSYVHRAPRTAFYQWEGHAQVLTDRT